MEEWKDIEGYEGLYKISNKGRVLSLYDNNGNRRNLILSGSYLRGYHKVDLIKDGVPKKFQVHRLVAYHFIPNPEHLPIVHHIDENPKNNSVDNLMWCTQSFNCRAGTGIQRSKEKRSKPIRCVETNTVYPSVNDAGRDLNIFASNICRCLKGRSKTCGGYHWEYA